MPKKYLHNTKTSSHLLNLLKEKDRIYPDVLASEYLEELLTFSRVAAHGYAICICNRPKFRHDLMFILSEKLKPAGIGFHTVKLSEKEQSLGRVIRILLESDKFLKFKKNYKKVVISIIGLDNTILEDERNFEKRPAALQGINQQRDYFRTLAFPLLIWVPEWLAALLPEFAPDFWVAKSVVFECLDTSEMITQSLSQLSGTEIEFDNLDQAKRKMRIYEKLIKVSEDRRTKSNFIVNLGIIHHMLGNYREAQKLYLQSLKISEELGNKRGIAQALHQLGTIHQKQGNYAEAVKKYNESLKIKQALRDKRGIAYTLGQLGTVNYLQGNYPEAQKNYEEVLKLSKELGDKSSIAITLHQLGMIRDEQGDYKEAVKKYEESLKIKQELGDKRGIAYTLGQLGNVYYEQGNYLEAQKKYEEVLKLSKELGDKSSIAISLHQLGMIRQQLGNYAEAVKKYEESLKIAVELGDKRGISVTLHQLGMIHQQLGNYAEAVKKYEESLKIAEELGDKIGIAISLHQLGIINEEQKDYTEAMRKYSISLPLFKQLESPNAKIAEKSLARLREKMGEKEFEKVWKDIKGKDRSE